MVCWGTLGRLPNPNLLRWPRDAGRSLHCIAKLQCRSAATDVHAASSAALPQEAAASASVRKPLRTPRVCIESALAVRHVCIQSLAGRSTALQCTLGTKQLAPTGKIVSRNGSQAAAPALGRGKRRRLDDVCLELRPADARNVIQSWIVQGKVLVDGRVVTKAGTPVPPGAAVHINAVVPKFVCRCDSGRDIAMVCHLVPAPVAHGGDVDALPADCEGSKIFGWYNMARPHGCKAPTLRLTRFHVCEPAQCSSTLQFSVTQPSMYSAASSAPRRPHTAAIKLY